MRIGVFGGTFDPIHLGHLRAAENAREQLDLDRLFLIPLGIPPHRGEAHAGAQDRLAMVCLAAATHQSFVARDDEIRRPGPSYTVDTLSGLHEKFPFAAFHLILGSDTLASLPRWKDPDRLLSLCRIAVVARPGAPGAQSTVVTHDVVRGDGLPISSSDLRDRARRGLSLRYLVCDSVADYLARRRLYR